MLIFIKSWITPPQDSPSKESLVEVQKAYRVENIKEVSEVNALTNPKGKFRFSILLVTGERLFSSLYGTKEEAEMAQVFAITVLNAIELYFERFKHVPEHHATPVMFQAPDATYLTSVTTLFSSYSMLSASFSRLEARSE